MKVAYVINNMWYSGGQTRVIANKLNYWAEEGHDVYLLTADQFDHGDYYKIDPRVKRVDYGIGYVGTDQMPKEGFSYHSDANQASQTDETDPRGDKA